MAMDILVFIPLFIINWGNQNKKAMVHKMLFFHRCFDTQRLIVMSPVPYGGTSYSHVKLG